MRFKKNKEEETMLGITPLIDIVFLLLIFFMLTSHFHVASGIPIRLPKVAQQTRNENISEVIIAIDRNGRTYLKGEKIDLKKVEPRLKDFVEKHEVTKIILQADKEVKHGLVVKIMDIAKCAGITSIVIATKWNSKKEF